MWTIKQILLFKTINYITLRKCFNIFYNSLNNELNNDNHIDFILLIEYEKDKYLELGEINNLIEEDLDYYSTYYNILLERHKYILDKPVISVTFLYKIEDN